MTIWKISHSQEIDERKNKKTKISNKKTIRQ